MKQAYSGLCDSGTASASTRRQPNVRHSPGPLAVPVSSTTMGSGCAKGRTWQGCPGYQTVILLRLVTTEAKRTPERAWLAEVSAVVLQQSVADLHRAYRNYFAALAEMHHHPRRRRPLPRLVRCPGPRGAVALDPGPGRYRPRPDSLRHPEPRQAAPQGGQAARPRRRRPQGLPPPAQRTPDPREPSGRGRGSERGGPGRSALAKSIHDAGWSSFIAMLEYKAALSGRRVVKIGQRHPSSQLCSACGQRSGPKGLGALKVRTWSCLACDTEHDRDVNAALNISGGRAGRRCLWTRCRPPARVAAGVEAGTTLAGAA